MPKAKTKTKGVIKSDSLKEHFSDVLPVLPVAITAPTVEIIESATMQIATENDASSQAKTKKVKPKHLVDGICKSKQLKEKRTSLAKSSKRRTVRKPQPTQVDTFDSDDDKPLVSIGGDPCTSTPRPDSSNNIATNLTTVIANHKSQTIPKKRKKSVVNSQGESCDRVEYTSVVKSESVLVIKKQISLSEVQDECTPPKKIKHSIDDILCISNSPQTMLNSVEQELCDTKMDNSVSVVVTPDSQTVDYTPPVISDVNDQAEDISNVKVQLDEADNVDSDKTEPYEYNNISPTSTHGSSGRSFSPIPSTSKDNEAFEKNELRFKKSLRVDDDIEIIEVPVETIVVEDHSPECVVSETIDITDPPADDDVEFIGYSNIPKFSCTEIDDILNGGYGSRSNNANSSDCEIIDVDDIMAKSEAILQKYRRKKIPSTTVTYAPLQPEVQTVELESQLQLTDLDSSMIIAPTFVDFLEPEVRHVPSTLSSDPVMASTSSGASASNQQATTMTGIIGNFFKNSPVTVQPMQAAKTTMDNVCSTFVDLLEHMSSILGNSNQQVEDSSINAYATHMRNEPARQSVRETGSSYTNRLVGNRVVDTVNLDDHPYWRMDAPSRIDVPPMVLPVCHPTTHQFHTPVPVQMTTQDNNNKITTPPPPPPSDNNKGFGRTMECPICLESLTNRPLASTICGHIFCMACLQKALNAPGGKRCPTCRKIFHKKAQCYHPLFL